MDFLTNLFYFLVVIAILVFIHEFGHFLAARLCKMRVDTFSFGMGQRLFGWNKKSRFSFGSLPKDWQGDGLCDYRVSMFPIGGYVKIAGMVDESMDTEFLNSEPQPWEFRSKKTWQKAFTISAGVIMNALLTILFFTGLTFNEGKQLWMTTTIGYVENNSLAQAVGLKSGDKIRSINGKEMNNWGDCRESLTLKGFGNSKEIVVDRNSQMIRLNVDGKKIINTLTKSGLTLGLTPEKTQVFVRDVESLYPAAKAGLKSGDTIFSVNNEQIRAFSQLTSVLTQNKNKKIFLQWKRGTAIIGDSITPNDDGKIGFQSDQDFGGVVQLQKFNIFQSIKIGFDETVNSVDLFARSIIQIFKGNISAKQSLGGPIMIAKAATQQAKMGFNNFIRFMALLSITLAIINILPFPALDGGHLVFIVIEGIIKREISVKVKIAFQNVGMVLLFLLMGYMVFNDLSRVFHF